MARYIGQGARVASGGGSRLQLGFRIGGETVQIDEEHFYFAFRTCRGRAVLRDVLMAKHSLQSHSLFLWELRTKSVRKQIDDPGVIFLVHFAAELRSQRVRIRDGRKGDQRDDRIGDFACIDALKCVSRGLVVRERLF